MEDLKDTPQKSNKPKLFYFLIILAIIPIILLMIYKSNIFSGFKIPNNSTTKNEVKEFNSKFFMLKYKADGLKVQKLNPEFGILEFISEDKKSAFKVNSIQQDAKSIEGNKTPLENAMTYAIQREKPYYSEFEGKTEINGNPALIFSTNTPKDPATQKVLLPFKAYYVYIPTQVDGKEFIKIIKIFYYGDTEKTKFFEKMISEMQFKSE